MPISHHQHPRWKLFSIAHQDGLQPGTSRASPPPPAHMPTVFQGGGGVSTHLWDAHLDAPLAAPSTCA